MSRVKKLSRVALGDMCFRADERTSCCFAPFGEPTGASQGTLSVILPGTPAVERGEGGTTSDCQAGQARVGVLVAAFERVLADELAPDGVAGGGEGLELE